MYNNINEAAKKPALWIPILGFVNPVTAVAIGVIGIITYTAIKIFKKDNNKNERLPTVHHPLNNRILTVEPTVKSTVDKPPNTISNDAEQEDLNIPEKNEMIRQVMSELGKRSAQARARKRQEQ